DDKLPKSPAKTPQDPDSTFALLERRPSSSLVLGPGALLESHRPHCDPEQGPSTSKARSRKAFCIERNRAMYSVYLHLIPSKDESTTADESTTSDESTEDGLTDDGLIADSVSEDEHALASTSEASPVDNQDDCTWEYNYSENDFHLLGSRPRKWRAQMQ
ncbi:hypothetical protein ABHI18_011008, partial [Aspergillus niger]